MMTRSGGLCGPHPRGVLYRRPIVIGDRYIITKEHLDLSQSPDRPFQNDETVVVPVDDRKSEWHRVTVPTIRALGVQQVAGRSGLKVSRKTLQRWMDPSNAPPRSLRLVRVEKKIFDYVVALGLFDPGRMPVGIQIVGQRHADARTAGIARWLLETVRPASVD